VIVLTLLFVACGEETADNPAVPHPASDPASALREGSVQNVLLISIDTLRADRLETFGYDRPTSPNLAAFARRSVVFENARAQAPQTAPSHASLFTSQYPSAHRIVNVHGDAPLVHLLPEKAITLAEVLSAAGVETGAFVSGGNLTQKMAMDRGFDTWDEQLDDVSDRIDALMGWMLAPDRGAFFAVLHTYQVHAPYIPPADLYEEFVDPNYEGPLRARLTNYLGMSMQETWAAAVGPEYWEGMLEYDEEDVGFLSDLYDAEIRYVDQQFRRLFRAIYDNQELLANTAIIVLSDHGEEFREHGKYQHDQVFEELLHVPLIVRLPPALEKSGMVGRVSTPVELLDVAPTVTELMGVDDSEAGWTGRSLVPLLEDADLLPSQWELRPTFSELVVDPGPKYSRVVVFRGWKYIHTWQSNIDVTWEWLFHLQEDPLEKINLIHSEDPEAVRALAGLRELLRTHSLATKAKAEALGPAGAVEMDADMERLMRQLGYIR
jgi:arylsulfatase A-like enzyme